MSRRRAPIKRAGYEHANLSAHARAAFAIARAEFDDLGERQREALISCEPGVALAAVMRTDAKAYPLRVRRSLQLRALLKAGEAWELTAWGAIVREAGGTCEGAMVGKQGNTMNTALKTLTLGIALYTIPACGAGGIASNGGEGETSSAAELPGDGITCVEMTPGAVTCWVDWLAGVRARVILGCQAADAVSAGAWGPAYEMELPVWGIVLCHDITGTDGALCLFDGSRVLLTETINGWVPDLSPLTDLHEPVDMPCP